MIATAIIGALGPIANLVGGIMANKQAKAPDEGFDFFPEQQEKADHSSLYILLAIVIVIAGFLLIRRMKS